MRRTAVLACILLLAGCGGTEPATGSLAQYSGQWLVINYWAKWCKPCIKEIPELNQLDQAYDDVRVLGVNYDGASGEELALQVRELGVAFPTLAEDPAAELGVPRPVVLPTTLLVAPDGSIRQTLVGPQTMESLAESLGRSPADAGL